MTDFGIDPKAMKQYQELRRRAERRNTRLLRSATYAKPAAKVVPLTDAEIALAMTALFRMLVDGDISDELESRALTLHNKLARAIAR